jgi:hypothetical protein
LKPRHKSPGFKWSKPRPFWHKKTFFFIKRSRLILGHECPVFGRSGYRMVGTSRNRPFETRTSLGFGCLLYSDLIKTQRVLHYSERPKTGPSGFQMAIFWVRFSNINKMADHSKTGRFLSSFQMVMLAKTVLYKRKYFLCMKRSWLAKLDNSKTGQICPVIEWHLKTGPFDNQTQIKHSKTGLVRYFGRSRYLSKTKNLHIKTFQFSENY